MTMLITFLAALKAGDIWARFVAVGLVFAALFATSLVMLYRHDQRVAAEAVAKIERQQQEKINAAKAGADRVISGDDSRVRGFDRD